MPRVSAGRLEALRPDRPILLETGGRRIAVVRHGDSVHAVDDACPHAGGPLSEGVVMKGALVCPYHTWMWDLTTGTCVAGPQSARVRVYPAGVEAGEVWVELP